MLKIKNNNGDKMIDMLLTFKIIKTRRRCVSEFTINLPLQSWETSVTMNLALIFRRAAKALTAH